MLKENLSHWQQYTPAAQKWLTYYIPPHDGPPGTLVNMLISQDKVPFPQENAQKQMKEQIPEEGGDGWGPRAQGSEFQWNDRPVFGSLSVKVLVKGQLHGSLHGLDLGGAVPVQALHLHMTPLAGPLGRGFH